MKLTEEQKDIALRIAADQGIAPLYYLSIVDYAERFLAALPKPEPVYYQWRRKSDPWSAAFIFGNEAKATTEDSEVRILYTEAPIAPPASEQKPVAYMVSIEGEPDLGHWFAETNTAVPGVLYKPLYTAPQPDYKAQRDALLEALYLALPFVEDHEGDPCYKIGVVKKAVSTIKAAIASVKGGE